MRKMIRDEDSISSPYPRQLPRLAVLPAQKGGRGRVADELLRLRIPLQRPPGAEGDVAQVADRCRAVPDGHVADRRLAALDAREPVGMVAFGALRPYLGAGPLG